MPSYYYPEGYFGPVCDALVSDEEIANRSRPAAPGGGEGVKYEYVTPLPDADLYSAYKDTFGLDWSIPRLRCEVDDDGNLFNCLIDTDDFVPGYPFDSLLKDFGIKDNFAVPTITPESCSPFDTDINIRPVIRYNSAGTPVTYYQRERSTPVTYNVTSDNYWSEDGNAYAVWTNPETCTLPLEEQVVTYQINITTPGEYGFELASDDNASIFLNDDTNALLTGDGGIFSGGSLTTPYTTTTNLTSGILSLTVKCENSAAGFVDGDGIPYGEAFNWDRNPGGWFVKICQGGPCGSGNSISWVQSGPHPAWSDFMNDYAVFPSNTDPLVGVAQNATWNIDITSTGTYTLETQADNSSTFTWSGTSLGTTTSFTSSTTYNISVTSTGNYTLSVSVTNADSGTGVNNWSSNPAGVAWVLRNASNDVILTSLSLSTPANGNLIWHTRMATGYESYTQ